MTISDKRECLKYRYLSSKESVGSWGHEYVRHLTAELTQEWNDMDIENEKEKEEAKESVDTFTSVQDVELTLEPIVKITKEELLALAKEMVQFYMADNAEAEACDLLMEIEQVELLVNYVEKDNFQRVCLYLLRY